jgi:hypothetical protein
MAYTPTYQDITIGSAGLTATYSVDDQVDIYNVLADGGTVTLAGNISISSTGTPQPQTTYVFNFDGGFTLGSNTCTFFGKALTAGQCLYKQTITAIWDGSAWDVHICSDMSSGAKDINGADIVDGTIASAAIDSSGIALSKLTAATRGYMVRAGQNGVWTGVAASTNGTFVGGNGTDVGPLTMSGDATLSSGAITIANSAVTTVKINDAAVTAAKLSTECATELFIVPVSFETGEQGAYKLQMAFSGSVVNIYAEAVKAIAGTDAATITPKNQAGTTMTVTTPISFAASDTFGTAYSSAVTANNTFVDGDVISLTSAKTTAGGKALVTLEILRS